MSAMGQPTSQDHGQLVAAAVYAAGAGERIQGGWTTLQTNLMVLDGQFAGVAKQAFDAKKGEMETNLRNIEQALQTLAESVQSAANAVQAADEEAQQELSRIQAGLT